MILDMASFFEFGSAYTALSRVRRMDDIKLVSYPVAVMEADMKNEFVYWYKEICKMKKSKITLSTKN